jgi:hypothetical protein
MEWASTVLVPQERVTKGVPAGPPSEELGTRILLGGPVSRPQVLPDGPPDAADYTMVDLGVTFNPAKGEQIQGAWVQVLLSVDDGTAPAIAWSMAPERLTAPGTATTEVEVKADFKIVSVGAKTSLSGRQHTYLQALNPLRRPDLGICPDGEHRDNGRAAHDTDGAIGDRQPCAGVAEHGGADRP